MEYLFLSLRFMPMCVLLFIYLFNFILFFKLYIFVCLCVFFYLKIYLFAYLFIAGWIFLAVCGRSLVWVSGASLELWRVSFSCCGARLRVEHRTSTVSQAFRVQ